MDKAKRDGFEGGRWGWGWWKCRQLYLNNNKKIIKLKRKNKCSTLWWSYFIFLLSLKAVGSGGCPRRTEWDSVAGKNENEAQLFPRVVNPWISSWFSFYYSHQARVMNSCQFWYLQTFLYAVLIILTSTDKKTSLHYLAVSWGVGWHRYHETSICTICKWLELIYTFLPSIPNTVYFQSDKIL